MGKGLRKTYVAPGNKLFFLLFTLITFTFSGGVEKAFLERKTICRLISLQGKGTQSGGGGMGKMIKESSLFQVSFILHSFVRLVIAP